MRTSLAVLLALTLISGCKLPAASAPPAPPAELDPRIDVALQLRASDQREQALALLEKVRADALGRGDARSAAMALLRSADVLNDLNRGDEARSRYEEALREHLKNGD